MCHVVYAHLSVPAVELIQDRFGTLLLLPPSTALTSRVIVMWVGPGRAKTGASLRPVSRAERSEALRGERAGPGVNMGRHRTDTHRCIEMAFGYQSGTRSTTMVRQGESAPIFNHARKSMLSLIERPVARSGHTTIHALKPTHRARNCILAIQKRLQHRNANVQLYALTVGLARRPFLASLWLGCS